jgi:uncharacterized oxidoreductase
VRLNGRTILLTGGSSGIGLALADTVMAQLADGRAEITYQFSADASQASRAALDAMFARLNP